MRSVSKQILSMLMVTSMGLLVISCSDGKSHSNNKKPAKTDKPSQALILKNDRIDISGDKITGDINVLANDKAGQGKTLSVSQFNINGTDYQAGKVAKIDGLGSISISKTGELTVQLLPNYLGKIPQISYTVTDGTNKASSTIDISNKNKNQAPVLQPDNITTDGMTLTGDINVLANDKDVNNDTLQVTQFSVDTNQDKKEQTFKAGQQAIIKGIGTLSINNQGQVTLDVNSGYTGAIPKVTYTVTDGVNTVSSHISFTNNISADPLDQKLLEVEKKLNDPNVPFTTEEEDKKNPLNTLTKEEQQKQKRIEQAQELALYAEDPEPNWFETEVSNETIIGNSGETYQVGVQKLDFDGNRIGPVTGEKVRFEVRIQTGKNDYEYIPSEYQSDYVNWDSTNKGVLNITVPKTLTKGRLIVGIRPNLEDRGANILGERWSNVITVEVWPTKSGVISLNKNDVLFPKSTNAMDKNASMPSGVYFTKAELRNVLLDELKNNRLVYPLIVAGNSYKVGDKIDYRMTDKVGMMPYSGTVSKVISNKKNQQILIIEPTYFDVYDIVDVEDGFLAKQGIAPEFVVHRQGGRLSDNNNPEPKPLTHFGPNERSVIQNKDKKEPWFKPDCKRGSAVLTFTPEIAIFPKVYAGITFSAGAAGTAVECKWTTEPKFVSEKDKNKNWRSKTRHYSMAVSLSNSNLVTRLLKFVLGTDFIIEPYGEFKIKLSSDMAISRSDMMLTAYAYSHKGSGYNVKWLGSDPMNGLESQPNSHIVELGASAGAKAKLVVIDFKEDSGVLGKLLSFVGLADKLDGVGFEAKLGLFATVKGESANAARANGGTNSSLALSSGVEFSGKFSKDIEYLIQRFGKNSSAAELKVRLKIIEKKYEAKYKLGEVDDDGAGNASVDISPESSLIQLFGENAHGYTALKGSSVFNDRNRAISYDTKECNQTINTPVVACMGGFFCAKTDNIKLCGGQIKVKAVSASGVEGEQVSSSTTVNLSNSASDSVDKNKTYSVSLSGSPLAPHESSFNLKLGQSKTVKVSTTCPSVGVHEGKIRASTTGSDDTQDDVVTCRCKKGTKDCDNIWGDPYLLTADGLAYDYVASGDYILQRIVDKNNKPIHGLEVQGRFLPGYDVSWTYGAAVQIGNDVVEVVPVILGHGRSSIGMEIKVNGAYLYPPAQNGSGGSYAPLVDSRLIKLPSGGKIFIDAFVQQSSTYKPRKVTLIWSKDSQFKGYGLTLSVPEGQFENPEPFMDFQFIRPNTFAGQERGMMGNNDGNPDNDLMRRNGSIIEPKQLTDRTRLYALFGGDWLAKGSECLFSDGCRQPDFPTSTLVLTPEQRAIGEASCQELRGFYKEACIHDVGLTGNPELVKKSYENSDDLNYMADKIITPGVDTAVYTAKWVRSSMVDQAYNMKATVTHVLGEGKYLLTAVPPKGATVTFDDKPTLIAELANKQSQQHDIRIDCSQADTLYKGLELGAYGHAQLWSVDPLSGFAKTLLSETRLSCDSGQRMAAGDEHKLLLDNDGQLWAWGSNAKGQLGNGGKNNYTYAPEKVTLPDSNVERITHIAAGATHSIALDNNGKLWAWGDNTYGQLGNGSNVYDRPVPVEMSDIKADNVSIVTIAAGRYHSMALDDKGQLWAWGRNNYGQLGIGNKINKTTPVKLNLSHIGHSIIQISSGDNHIIVLDDQGQVWSWGTNVSGQLGHGQIGTDQLSLTPTQVDLTAISKAKPVSITAGANHNLLIDSEGRVWAWGDNTQGQLGNGKHNTSLELVQVDRSQMDSSSQILSVTAAGNHSVALDAQGKLYTWGQNNYGQLGQGDTANKAIPHVMNVTLPEFTDIISVVAGGKSTSFLDSQGYLYSTGNDSIYRYGISNRGSYYSNSSQPRIIAKLTGEPEYRAMTLSPQANAQSTLGSKLVLGTVTGQVIMPLGKTDDIKLSAALNYHGTNTNLVTLNRTTDFDFNIQTQCQAYGQQKQSYELLNGQDKSITDKPSMLSYLCYPDLDSKWRVNQDNGDVYLIVTNKSSEPANVRFNQSKDSWTPTLVSNKAQSYKFDALNCNATANQDQSITVVANALAKSNSYYKQDIIFYPKSSCGNGLIGAGYNHSMVLSSKGRVWTWGSNHNGQLGGHHSNYSYPVSIALDNMLNMDIVDFATGNQHNLILDSKTNQLWAWGSNGYGQLGNGDSGFDSYSIRPIKVDQTNIGKNTLVDSSAGYYHSLALDNTGQVWAWGANYHGELGTGNTINQSIPTAIDISNIKQAGSKLLMVEAGFYHSLALDDKGNVWAWGYNNHKQLGHKTANVLSKPTLVDTSVIGNTGAKVVQIATGNFHNLILDNKGKLWAWGNNSQGQLGNGNLKETATPVAVDMSKLPKDATIKKIVAGGNHSLILLTSGDIWAWGSNKNGALGNSTITDTSTPIKVDQSMMSDAKVLNITTGGVHSLALDNYGQIWSWGQNRYGQLGNRTNSASQIPVKVYMTDIDSDNQTQ